MSLKRGRPTVYTRQLAIRICKLVAAGHSLREIESIPSIPRKSTILGWLADGAHAEFELMYAKAMELRAEYFADESIYIMKHEKDPQRMRAQLEFIRWHAAVMAPKKHGNTLLAKQLGEQSGSGDSFNFAGQVVLMLPDNRRANEESAPPRVIELDGKVMHVVDEAEEERKRIEQGSGLEFLTGASVEDDEDELERIQEEQRTKRLIEEMKNKFRPKNPPEPKEKTESKQ